jgi:hypothetical protein
MSTHLRRVIVHRKQEGAGVTLCCHTQKAFTHVQRTVTHRDHHCDLVLWHSLMCACACGTPTRGTRAAAGRMVVL